MPRLRWLRTRWIVTISDSRNISFLDTKRAPSASALSFVRFWLQAMTFMPNPLRFRRRVSRYSPDRRFQESCQRDPLLRLSASRRHEEKRSQLPRYARAPE